MVAREAFSLCFSLCHSDFLEMAVTACCQKISASIIPQREYWMEF